MRHRLGDKRDEVLFIKYKVGSLIRLYYQFRNVFLLSRRGYVPMYWKLRNFTLMFVKLAVQPFRHKDDMQRVKYMLKGIKDGLLARTGKIKKTKRI